MRLQEAQTGGDELNGICGGIFQMLFLLFSGFAYACIPREGVYRSLTDIVQHMVDSYYGLHTDHVDVNSAHGLVHVSVDNFTRLIAMKDDADVDVKFANKIASGISSYTFIVCNPCKRRIFAGVFYDQDDIHFNNDWWGNKMHSAVLDLLSGSCANLTYALPGPDLESLNGAYMVVKMVINVPLNSLTFKVNGYWIKTLMDLRSLPMFIAWELTHSSQKVYLVHHSTIKDSMGDDSISILCCKELIQWFEDRQLLEL